LGPFVELAFPVLIFIILFLSGVLVFFERTTCLARGRHIVYSLHICCLLVWPTITGFVDSLDLSVAVCVRRLLWLCIFASASAGLFQKVLLGPLTWPLLGFMIYLIRLLTRLSAIEEGYRLTPALETSAAGITALLPALVLIGMTFHVRQSSAKHAKVRGNEVESFNRTLGNVWHVNSLAVVPDDVCHGATSSIQGGLQAGGYQNDYEEARIPEHPSDMMELIHVHGHGAFDGLLIENTQANDDEHGYKSKDEHDCMHEAFSHVAKVTQAHDDEQLQRVEVLIPASGEAQSLLPEARTESPALCQEDSSLGMMGIRVHKVSGELVCEHWVYDWEPFTIKDLKCIVGEKIAVDPLMVVLVEQHMQEPLDNGVMVVTLPTASLTRDLHFTAVFCTTKAYVRDQLLLQADCVPADASWPSISLSSYCDNDQSMKFREEE
jgi:hypothetical protein